MNKLSFVLPLFILLNCKNIAEKPIKSYEGSINNYLGIDNQIMSIITHIDSICTNLVPVVKQFQFSESKEINVTGFVLNNKLIKMNIPLLNDSGEDEGLSMDFYLNNEKQLIIRKQSFEEYEIIDYLDAESSFKGFTIDIDKSVNNRRYTIEQNNVLKQVFYFEFERYSSVFDNNFIEKANREIFKSPVKILKTGKNVFLRELPDSKSKSIKLLKLGEQLFYLGGSGIVEKIDKKSALWIKVKDSQDNIGFVYSFPAYIYEIVDTE